MTRVWKHSKTSGSDLLLMLAIADHADDHGRAYPSVPTLAVKTRLSARSVQRAIHALEKTGELAVRRNDGPHGCHVFHLLIAEGDNVSWVTERHRRQTVTCQTHDSANGNDLGMTECHEGCQSVGVTSEASRGDIAVSPEPSLEPLVKILGNNTPASTPPSKPKRIPESQQPGVIVPALAEAIHGMINEQFHGLANPNKLNEKFWDAQVNLIDEWGLLTVYHILSRVDAYYSAHRDKLVRTRNEKAARERMAFAIQFEMNKTDREERYAARTR